MVTKTVKDVDERTWRKLRVLASEENTKMGTLLKNMTETYIKSREDVWNEILKGKKILSDEEADDMQKIVKKLRSESGFR